MEFTDQYYMDADGKLRFLSAEDQQNLSVDGVFTPDSEWTAITIEQGKAIENPPLTIDQLKVAQINTISQGCQNYIYAGFTSSALGIPYTYPAADKDQANLSASVVASILPGVTPDWKTQFWCADATGAWAFRDHTAAQIQQVGIDGKDIILAAMAQNATLAAKVLATTTNTAAKVAAIVWVNPS